jgi:hypothetical protein
MDKLIVAISAGAVLAGVTAGVCVDASKKEKADAFQAAARELRGRFSSIHDCMKSASQDLCVAALPERVNEECHTEPYTVTERFNPAIELSPGIGLSFSGNMGFSAGNRMLSSETKSGFRLKCDG